MGGLIVKSKWALMLVVLVVVLTGCGERGPSDNAEPAVQDSAPQQPPPATVLATGKTVVADGRLASAYPSLGLTFGGGVSGRVLAITVRPGDVVQAGDLLALLDETELQRAVDDAQMALDRTIADQERAHQQWERDVADAEHSLAGAERAVDDAQLAVDRAIADRERARRQRERDVADAEHSLAETERLLITGRLQFTDTPLEQARTNLDSAQQAEANAKKAYEDAQAFGRPIHIDPYRDGWERAIRGRELAEMQLADTQDAHSADYLALESREANVAQAERTLGELEEDIAPSLERAIEDTERALARAQETLTHARLTASWVGIAPSYGYAVEDAERALAGAQETLVHARLTAPWAAVVLSVNVAPEATIGPGAPIVTLLDVEDGLLFVAQDLGEQHVADVYVGQRAVVTLRTFADEPLEGTIEAIVSQTEAAVTSAHFFVHVRLSPTDLRLLPGLTGRVEIFVGD